MGQVAARVSAIYRSYGYCAHPDHAAVAGSAPAFVPGWGTWTKRLEALLRQSHWDVAVAFFQGNGAPTDPDVIVHAHERETLKMIDAATRTRGADLLDVPDAVRNGVQLGRVGQSQRL